MPRTRALSAATIRLKSENGTRARAGSSDANRPRLGWSWKCARHQKCPSGLVASLTKQDGCQARHTSRSFASSQTGTRKVRFRTVTGRVLRSLSHTVWRFCRG